MISTKTALITGATSGIGIIVAEHLAKTGYNLVILGRSPEKLDVLLQSLAQINKNIEAEGILCDFSSFASTLNACNEVREKYPTLNLMVLNAGIWNVEDRNSHDGIEETLHVNLISQIQVFKELNTLIPKDGESKVIITASSLHQGKIDFDDIEYRKKFSGFKVYRQSKLGLLLLTRWLAEQKEHNGISFYSIHPGVVRTDIARSSGWTGKLFFKLFGKSPLKGAQTHVHVIDSENRSLKNGAYYANKKVTKTTPYSYDLKMAERLWKKVSHYLQRA